MSDEMKVQTKGFNKKFLFVAITLVVVGLVAALVLLIPTSAKAKKVEEQLNLGAKYLSELDYEQAIVAYEAVIEIDPKCEEAYLALADIYIATGEFEKAEDVLKRAEEEIGAEAQFLEEKRQEVLAGQKQAESTPVPSPTEIPTPEPTATLTVTPTNTPSPTPTNTPSPTPMNTPAEIENEFIYSIERNEVKILGLRNREKTEINIPAQIEGCSVTTIGEAAFYNCNLSSVNIPDSVVHIESSAFSNCNNLASIVIPNSVTDIGDYAFAGCSNLRNIALSNNVVNIGEWAFSKCTALREIIIPDGVTSIAAGAFCECSSLEKVVLPNGIKDIGMSAFLRCGNLKSIDFPDSVTSIGNSAFSGCGLTDVFIPKSVSTIEYWAFGDGNSLVIYTPGGSYAEQWANVNGISVVTQ